VSSTMLPIQGYRSRSRALPGSNTTNMSASTGAESDRKGHMST
jgi:hypothetical protein